MSGNPQIIFIDGGRTFSSRDDYLNYLREREVSLQEEEKWYKGSYLEEALQSEVFNLGMPCRDNARYEEWRINFENYIPLFSQEIVLIGLSLGGTFLAKYLSENRFPKKIVSAYLLGAPYDDDLGGEEELSGGFDIGSDLSLLEENCEKLSLIFSEDDEVVPLRHAEKFEKRLSSAEVISYESVGGHFQAKEFPQLVEKIKEEADI